MPSKPLDEPPPSESSAFRTGETRPERWKEKMMLNSERISTGGKLATIFFALLTSFSAVAAAVGPAVA